MSEGAGSWRLVSPMGLIEPSPAAIGSRSGGSTGLVLGFLSNRKPNAGPLQRLLGDRISAAMPSVEVRYYEKGNSSLGAAPDLLDQVAADCGLAVNGTGD